MLGFNFNIVKMFYLGIFHALIFFILTSPFWVSLFLLISYVQVKKEKEKQQERLEFEKELEEYRKSLKSRKTWF